jgi:hypothetical protein
MTFYNSPVQLLIVNRAYQPCFFLIADKHCRKMPATARYEKNRQIVIESLVTMLGKRATEECQMGTDTPLPESPSIPLGQIDCRDQYGGNTE